MATPTEAEVQAQIRNRIAILEELRKFAHSNSSGSLSNYIAREDTDVQAQEGDFAPESLSALFRFRSLLNAAIVSPTAQDLITPLFRAYAKVVGTFPETDINGILDRIYQYMIDNSLSVNSRGISFGAVSAGSNIGDGTVNRLRVDENNLDIEAIHFETKRLECVSDEHTGAVEHEEVFEVRGQDLERDTLQITGSGIRKEIRALSARNSLIGNPSFSQFAGTIAAPTAITNWTVTSSINNFQLDETNTYRDFQGDSTPRAVLFETNDTLSQNFNVRALQLDDDTPYYCQIAFNRAVGSCDGTLTLWMGAQSASVTLAAQTGWNILRIALGRANWPKNFTKMENPQIRIQLSGRTAGTLLVDDVIFAPFDRVDNTYLAVVGGASPFVLGDTFSYADSLSGSDAIIQQWLWRAFNRYLPHNGAGAETWADPTV